MGRMSDDLDQDPRSPVEPDPVPPKVVVGLGNPGLRYRMTRHNAGFFVVERLAEIHHAAFRGDLGLSDLATIEVAGTRVDLARPRCYMNRSGAAIAEILAWKGDEKPEILIVYDDFHLPVGRVRFRARGSAGGHNGMQSILDCMGTVEVARLRVGVGSPPPGEDPADFVLDPVPRGDRDALREAVETAAEGVEFWSRGGTLAECMNRYN
jgi:PTH1 family peptidyl-tRNA hydrolase